MEAFGSMLKFRRNAAAGDDGDEWLKAAALGTDDEETDDEESFFDLVFKSPDREAASKDFQCIESAKDVFMSKIDDFSDLNASSPVTPLHSISNPNSRVFKLGLSKSSKCEKLTEYNCELKANQFSKCRVKSKETSDRGASSRDAVRKYLELIKPLYVKVSKRNYDKSQFTEHSTTSSSPPVKFSASKFSESRIGSFKIARKHLQKSRSASAAEIDAALPPVCRKDDSLLEQNDGIRGAILHCKKSYNSSSKEVSNEKLGPLPRNTDDR